MVRKPPIILILLLFVVFLNGCISGRLAGRRSLSTTPHGYSVVSDIVRAGKEAQRFEVRGGRLRSRLGVERL